MKRRIVGLVAVAVATAGLVGAPADAAPKKYKNCDAMHQDYLGGVARAGAKDKRRNGGKARYKPYVNTKLYNANTKSDRDNDGIACER